MNTEEKMKQIKDTLIEQKIWLSVAESLTCGKLQSIFGEVSGISNCFKGGITAYSIDEKVKFLKVDHLEANQVNCVSDSIARQMAKGVSDMFESEIGIGTTGYAEQYKEHQPHAYYSIYWKNKNSKDEMFISDRIDADERNRTDFQAYVVEIVVKRLLKTLSKTSKPAKEY